MSIDRNITNNLAPFGGAELNVTGTHQETLRSSERRRRVLAREL